MSSSLLWDVDVDAIHQTITTNQEAIISLDQEIEEHSRAIGQLQGEKAGRLAEIKRCKGLITLAARLPSEILASIFEECARGRWENSPWALSQVCSRWRQSMSPQAWSCIYVRLDNPYSNDRTQLWLKNSQEALINLFIKAGHGEYSDFHIEPYCIMDMLTPEMRRWKTLTIRSYEAEPVRQILHACTEPAPHLELIDISVSNGPSWLALRTLSTNASQVKSLHMKCLSLPGPNILSSSITNLSLVISSLVGDMNHSVSTFIAALQDLPILVSFSLESIEYPVTIHHFDLADDPRQVADLPHLKSISITGSNNILGILPHLRAPALACLRLRSTGFRQASISGTWITQLLQESRPPISVLDIYDVPLEPPDYGPILRHLPSLRALRLHKARIVDSTLQELISDSGICPSLRRLDLRRCGNLSEDALVKLVRSRIPCNMANEEEAYSAIEEVTVIKCPNIDEEELGTLNLAKLTALTFECSDFDDFCEKKQCCRS